MRAHRPPRATTHRIAVALEKHRLIQRDEEGRWHIGQGVIELAPRSSNRLLEAADEVLPELVQEVGEAVQVYRRSGLERVCVAAISPSAPARYCARRPSNDVICRFRRQGSTCVRQRGFAKGGFTDCCLRRRGARPHQGSRLVESVAERDASLASCSVPILDSSGSLVAALSTSGPVERLRPSPQIDTRMFCWKELERSENCCRNQGHCRRRPFHPPPRIRHILRPNT